MAARVQRSDVAGAAIGVLQHEASCRAKCTQSCIGANQEGRSGEGGNPFKVVGEGGNPFKVVVPANAGTQCRSFVPAKRVCGANDAVARCR